jgi:hypothetical protein
MKVWLQMNFRKSVHACSIAFGFVIGLSFSCSAAIADELVGVFHVYRSVFDFSSFFKVFMKTDVAPGDVCASEQGNRCTHSFHSSSLDHEDERPTMAHNKPMDVRSKTTKLFKKPFVF